MSQTNNMTELDSGLKKLYLATSKDCYSDEADLARQEALSYELYLQELVIRECEERSRKALSDICGSLSCLWKNSSALCHRPGADSQG
jgi:hypothetical protein